MLIIGEDSQKTPLSSQVGNLVLIDVFNVLSRVLSMVLFLRASCCFPAEKKTRSIPPPDSLKDGFLTELVIRDVRNRVFYHPLLQLIESLWVDI
jgi:hypothetical protein